MANGLGAASGALTGAASGAALGPLGAAAGGLLGGLSGLLGGGNNDAADAAYQKAIDEYNKIGTPPNLDDPLVLQGFQQAGALTPELLQKLNLNADKQNTLVENPEDKKQQQYALSALKDLSQTGLSPEDRAAFNQLQRQVGGDTQAKTNQILQQQQMRGQGSAGSTLAAQLSAIQGGNQTASEQADQIAAQASAARRGALSQFSNLAGQMRGSDLDVQKLNLQNELQRQQFLDQNSLSRQNANVAAQNAANQINLQRQQSVSTANTAAQNQELARQKTAEQQMYQDQLQKAAGIAGAYGHQAQNFTNEAANQASSTAGLATAGLGALKSLGTEDSNGVTDWSKIFGSGGDAKVASTGGGSGSIGASPTANMARGGFVTGKEIIPGDSEINDVHPVNLSSGELVIPKSFAHDPDLSKAYINFVHKNLKKQVVPK